MKWFLCIATVACLAGCGPSEISGNDQKAAEAKYNQQAYEKAMIANGRGKELEEQDRINAERKAASQDR